MHKIYKLNPPIECSPILGNFIALFNISKERIVDFVERLSISQLDFRGINNDMNSIGTLLMHCAALENQFRILTIENRSLNQQELSTWFGALPGSMETNIIIGNPVNYYLNRWDSVRCLTLEALIQKNDEWLFESLQNTQTRYYMWYHVMEDHLCHLGQIKVLIKNCAKNNV